MSKVLLIDGNSIMNRTFYAIPLLTNAKGEYTNAIYGFLNILLKLLDEEAPTHIGVAFDLKKPTFRHEHYAEYKGNRKSMPDELRAQMPIIKELLQKMNISIFEKEGYEADDILGTLAKRYEKEGMSVSLVSGDRDMLQIATDNIKIRIPKTSKGKTEIEDYFAKDVVEKYQVTPQEFIDVKALMGDASDNIPGVPGIGEKTAIKVISEYKSVENALENIETLTPKGAAEKIANNKEQAIMSKYLATICLEVPIEEQILEKPELFNDESYEMLKGLEFRSIIEKLAKEKLPKVTGEVQKICHSVQEITDVNRLSDIVKELKNVGSIVFKIFEDSGKQKQQLSLLNEENNNSSNVWGIGLAYGTENFIIKCSNNLSFETIIKSLKSVLENDKIVKVSHDIKKDIKAIKKISDIEINKFEDLMVAHYVLNPTKEKYDYNDISSEFMGEYVSSSEEVFGKGKDKKNITGLSKEEQENYIGTCLCVMTSAREIINKRIKDNELEKVLYEIEYPLIKVLADMEYAGIKVNIEYLKEYTNKINKTINHLESEIYAQAGEKFNISSPKQLGEILFEKLKLPVIKKTKTGYSTDVEVLEKLSKHHEVVEFIMEYRHLIKLKTTYADGLADYINASTGKIYTTFNQTVAATGRLSSTDPNLQNIPIKLDIGREIRKIFVPSSSDYVFMDADYSQIELRVLAGISGDETLTNAYKQGQDIHKLTASQVFGVPFDEVTNEQRSNAKAVNFGIVYGIGAFSLSQDIGVSPKEAERYINNYLDKYPKIREYMKSSIDAAKEKGYSETLFGRKREIPELRASNFMQRAFGERVAMNTPIQGTAADIIKIAMIKLHKELKDKNMKSRIILQVHDELLVEAYRPEYEEVKAMIKYNMEHAVKLDVPMEVDVNTGENWLEAH